MKMKCNLIEMINLNGDKIRIENKNKNLFSNVMDLRKKGFSYNQISKKLDIPSTTIQNWIKPINKTKYLINYYRKNKEKISIKNKKYREQDEYKKKMQKYKKEYKIINKEKIRQQDRIYEQQKCKNDIQYKLKKRLRSRIYSAIKNKQKNGSAIRDLGCNISEFIQYIEDLWTIGMCWENYGEWHLDHILPLSSFNLNDREQFLVAAHYTNIQPLWAEDNLRKSNKILTSNMED